MTRGACPSTSTYKIPSTPRGERPLTDEETYSAPFRDSPTTPGRAGTRTSPPPTQPKDRGSRPASATLQLSCPTCLVLEATSAARASQAAMRHTGGPRDKERRDRDHWALTRKQHVPGWRKGGGVGGRERRAEGRPRGRTFRTTGEFRGLGLGTLRPRWPGPLTVGLQLATPGIMFCVLNN